MFKAGKRVFIDKPVAGTLADAIRIDRLAAKHKAAWFSSSSFRYSPSIRGLRGDPKLGDVVGCDAYGPCPTEEHHPDLFWYGVHGVESLYTVMGTGCVSVSRVRTEGTELVTGVWDGGRVGTFRGIRAGKADYGALAFGSRGIVSARGMADMSRCWPRFAHSSGPADPPSRRARPWKSSPSWKPPTRASGAAGLR